MAVRMDLERGKRGGTSLSGMLFLVMLALGVAATGCLSDSDKCDDMKLVTSTDENFIEYCTPYKDTAKKPVDTSPPEKETETAQVDGGEIDTADVGCTGNDDCAGDDYCDLTLNPPACLPPPTGQGTPCENQSDCAGFEADYCELYVSFSCLVQNCDTVLHNCTKDRICCDFEWMGLPSLCVDGEESEWECYEP